MSAYIKEIDAYINKAADFAQPILQHIREVMHEVCPDVEEKIKWSMPFFDYKGPMCNMAAFKNHASFGFWKAALMSDPALVATAKSEVAMGHLGRLTSMKDLPSDRKLSAYIKEAMKLNENEIKLIKKPKTAENKEIAIPDYFTKAISKHKKAKDVFEKFSYSHRKEYIVWITEARTDATRDKRLIKAIELMTEGKSMNWKYQRITK